MAHFIYHRCTESHNLDTNLSFCWFFSSTQRQRVSAPRPYIELCGYQSPGPMLWVPSAPELLAVMALSSAGLMDPRSLMVQSLQTLGSRALKKWEPKGWSWCDILCWVKNVHTWVYLHVERIVIAVCRSVLLLLLFTPSDSDNWCVETQVS